MVHTARENLRTHSTSHELLRLGIDHAVFFRKQKPRRFRRPFWRRCHLLNALKRNGPLDCSEDSGLVGRGFVGDCAAKSVFRHPDKAVLVWRQFRRFWMGFVAIKHLGDRLALTGRKRSDINEGLHSLFAYRPNDRSSVSMAG